MKKELNVPTSLSEITLGQYQRYHARIQNKREENQLLIMLQELCGLNSESSRMISTNDALKVQEVISKAFTEEYTFTQRFFLETTEFGFIPNLDKIKLGAFLDINNYLNSEDWSNMHKAMAAMYRPVKETQGDKYLIEDYHGSEDFGEIMKHMPLDIVIGSQVFFWNLELELLTTTLQSLNKEIQEGWINTVYDLNSITSGDGTPLFTLSQTVKPSKSTKPLSLKLGKPSRGYHSKKN